MVRIFSTLSLLFWLLHPVWGSVTSYANISTAIASSSASQYEFCGCTILADIDSWFWYDQIFNITNSTVIYYIENSTDTTVSSEVIASNQSSVSQEIYEYIYNTASLSYLDADTTSVVAFNENVPNILIQTNYFMDFSYKMSTWNTTTSGNFIAGNRIITYIYTTSYIYPGPYGNGPVDTAMNAGNSYVASCLASSIGAQNCSLVGEGIGILKVPVSMLTQTSISYVAAETTGSGPNTVVSSAPPTTSSIPASPPPNLTVTTPTPTYTTSIIPTSPIDSSSVSIISSTSSIKSTSSESSTPLASYAPTSNLKSGGRSDGGAGATQTITTIETIGSSLVTVIILPSDSGYIVGGTTLSNNGPAENINGVLMTANTGGLAVVSVASQLSSSSASSAPAGGIAAAIYSQLGLPLPAPSSSGEETYTVLELSGGSDVIIEGQTLTSGGIVVVGGETLSLALGGSGIVVGGTTTESFITGFEETGKQTRTLSGSQPAQVTAAGVRSVEQINIWKALISLGIIVLL